MNRQGDTPMELTAGRSLIVALLVVSAWFPGETLAAAPASQGPGLEPPALSTTVGRTSLDEAVRKVRDRFGGKVLKASTQTRNGRAIHHIRLLTDDGRVRTVRVDAETGRILG